MLDNVGTTEVQYIQYFQQDADEKQQRAALQAALQLANKTLTQANTDLANLEKLESHIQDNLAALAGSVQTQQLALQRSEHAFQQKVIHLSGCTFANVLQCMAAFVSMATDAFHAADSIIASVKDFAGSSSGTDFVKDLKTTIGTISDLQKQITAFQDAFKDNNSKIAITQDKLDSLLSQFSNLAEAATLKSQIDTYSQTCLTRSQKALDLTGAEAQRLILSSKIQATQSDITRIQGQIADNADPTLPDYVQFIGNLLAEAKQKAVHALYQEHRAYEYWSLTYVPFAVPSYDLVVLRNLHQTIKANALQAQIDRNRAPQTFGTNGANPIRVTLSRDTNSSDFFNFRQSGRMTFAIPRDHPAFKVGFAAITLKGVVARIVGVRTKNKEVSIQLVHHGRAEFLDSSKNLLVFSHEPRTTQVVYSQTSGAITDDSDNLGQDGSFAALSPFATWTISVLPENNQELDLSDATDIILDFSGFFFPFNK